MGEYFFDIALIVVGGFGLAIGWWLLVHNSDRRMHRIIRQRYELPGMSEDETIASRSLFVAFAGIFLKLFGALFVIAGIFRLFGYGRD
jgi:hypothetical protein